MKPVTILVALVSVRAGVALAADVEITSSIIDVYGDGRVERVSVVMQRGKLHDDRESMGCEGALKYQGRFAVTVQFADGRKATTPLWSDDENSFFYAETWRIVFEDYNRDGIADFNLGQYDNCNGNYYTLYSFKPDGRVFEIGHALRSGRENSSKGITVTGEGYSSTIHNSIIGGPTEIFYKWDAASQFFEPYRRTDCYGCVGSDKHREVELKYIKATKEFVPVKEVERVLNRETKEYEVVKERTISP